jgi:pyridoxal phosphate enzyme (YggS family)
MADPRIVLANRLAMVEERITAACRRGGRERSQVTLVAVTKTVGAEVAALLPALGVRDLGENRPQELWRKAALLSPGARGAIVPRASSGDYRPPLADRVVDVRWHLIGHLQRNKVERTVPLVCLIHSVDSLRLLHELEATNSDGPLAVLLEVNASGEGSKHGFRPDEVAGLARPLERLRRVRVDGLMTMAAPESDAERCRSTFALLRELRDQLGEQIGHVHPVRDLSMGMSNDFEVAIEEGATLVRLGSVLFEGLTAEET